MNSTNVFFPETQILYKAEVPDEKVLLPLSRGCFQGRVVKIELYNHEGTIERVSAFTFHPYRTTRWNALKCWLKELCLGKTTVLVRVAGESQALYVKIDDLSRVLKTPPKKLQRRNGNAEATEEILKYNAKNILIYIQRISRNLHLKLNKYQVHRLKDVISKIPYQNIRQIIETKNFDQKKLIFTLVAMGRAIHLESDYRYHFSPLSYPFEIDNKTSKFSIIDEQKGFNLRDLSFSNYPSSNSNYFANTSFLDFSQARLERLKEKFGNIDKNPNTFFEQFRRIASDLQLPAMTIEQLHALKTRIKPSYLIAVLESINEPKKKAIMFRTFASIADKLRTNHNTPIYQGKVKINEDEVLTHAFAIYPDKIFVNQLELDEGNTKVVSTALELTQLNHEENWVRIKIKDDRPQAIEDAKTEAERLKELYKSNPYLVSPYTTPILIYKRKKGSLNLAFFLNIFNIKKIIQYIYELFTSDSHSSLLRKKMVAFQIRYEANGLELIHAPIIKVLTVFRDVAKSLSLLHNQKWVHSDVKLANIYIKGSLSQSDSHIRGCIGDLGMMTKQGELISGGTQFYMPPEALIKFNDKLFYRTCPAKPSFDSFSLGISILQALDRFHILDKKPNFIPGLMRQDQMDGMIKEFVAKIEENYKLDTERQIALDMLEICRLLLIYDSSQRLSCSETANRLAHIESRFTI